MANAATQLRQIVSPATALGRARAARPRAEPGLPWVAIAFGLLGLLTAGGVAAVVRRRAGASLTCPIPRPEHADAAEMELQEILAEEQAAELLNNTPDTRTEDFTVSTH